MGNKVPFVKSGVMNLLKVIDLPPEDQATLVKMGFGDILNKAGNSSKTSDYQMDLEETDDLKANTIMFKFLAFKTS